MLELVTCTLLMVGAPGSLTGCGAPLIHEPFVRIWSDTTTGTMVTLAPLAIFTHDCTKFVAFVCTVPLTHPPGPPLLVGVAPPPVVMPGREQAANKILPSASTTRI